jgi:hypothetical protein
VANLVVELLWDEKELGEEWMNIDNLKSCVYGKTHTTEELCQVRLMKPSEPQWVFIKGKPMPQ